VRRRHRRPPAAQHATPPPAARGTANNTPPFFPAKRAVGAAENFTAENFGGKKVSEFTEILFLLVRHYLWNIRRTVLDIPSRMMHPPRDSFKSAAGHTLPLDPREKRKR